MGYTTVILVLSSAVIYVSATMSFGERVEGTRELVEKRFILYDTAIIKFNLDKKFDLIIDKIVIGFRTENAYVRKLEGGPGYSYFKISVKPDERVNGLNTRVTILGRWNRHSPDFSESAITYD